MRKNIFRPQPFHSPPRPKPRGLLLTLDVIVVFLFLVSITQPYLLQTGLGSIQHQERAKYDERVSLLLQVSQRLLVTGAAMHQNSNDLGNTLNYTLVGYYEPSWKSNAVRDKVLPPLDSLGLSLDLLDAIPTKTPIERVCVSREMADASKNPAGLGDVHTLVICDR